MLLATLLGACALAARTALAFNFIVDNSTVNECGSVQFNWTTGTPPYQITGIGVFDVPVNVTVPESAVTANGGAYTWTNLPFNASSQVVFVMSDASGFATGGTSQLITVGGRPSGVADCKRTNGDVDWTFAVNPMDPETETSLPQCKAVSFTWQGAYQGPVSIIGVIPGGMVFGGAPSSGSEISYPMNVALGSNIVYVAWDSAGVTGGTSYLMRVTNGDSKCLDDSTASTTPSPPWNPTPTSGGSALPPSTTQRGGLVTITAIKTALPAGSAALTPGAIAGIVVGVICAVLILQALILWFCCRRQLTTFLANRKQKKARRSSGGIDLYEGHPGNDGLLGSGQSMRNQPHRVTSRGYHDDELGTTISPFMGGTTIGSRGSSNFDAGRQSSHMDSSEAYGDSPRISLASGNALGNGWSPNPGSELSHPPSSYPPPPPGGQHVRNSSGSSSQAPRLPSKLQLAMANPDNHAMFADGQPSPNTPQGGFRRHEDAGPLGPTTNRGEEVEDLPPTYNPQWETNSQR